MSKFSFDMTADPRDAGWIPPDARTVEQQRIHEQMLDDTPRVEEIFTSAGSNPDRPRLWQVVAKAIDRNLIPSEYLRNGQLKNITQIIGSCVGFGAGNMLLWASLIDALIRGQVERIVVPFVPYHYGKGRQHSGIRGKGSGSIGSGQAKALEVDGYIACDVLDVPKPAFGDSIKWTERIEYDWSDGAAIPQKYVEEGRKHTVKSTRVTSTDEAARLADSYYTFTIASSWGGRMQCPIRDGVLLNERVTQWMHQMWVLDYIDHPRLGRLWWVGNNWAYPHGKDPGGEWDGNTGAPEGGFYITDADLAYILRQNDSFAFADPQGYEDRSRAFDWLMG